MDLIEALRLAAPSPEITQSLTSDLDECGRNLDARPWNQFWRRMYVRTAISMVGGINSFMKQSIYSFHERNIRVLHHTFTLLSIDPPPLFTNVQPEGELLLLLEKTTSLTDNGKCLARDAFSPITSSIRFMFEMHKRVFQTTFIPNYSDKGWRELQACISTRNRLTHPQMSTALHVTEEETVKAKVGCEWYLNAVSKAGMEGVAIVKEFHQGISDFLKKLPKDQILLFAEISGYEVPPHLWAVEKLVFEPEVGNDLR